MVIDEATERAARGDGTDEALGVISAISAQPRLSYLLSRAAVPIHLHGMLWKTAL